MKERLPWLRLFVRDWLGSPVIARLTVEQEGVLLRLLLHAWEMPHCAIPEDVVLIANITKTPDMKVVQKVLDFCFERRVDVGFIPREPLNLPDEAARAEQLREQRRQAGKKSAEDRREKTGTAQPPNTRSSGRSAASNDGAGAGDGRNGRKEGVEEVESATDRRSDGPGTKEIGRRCEWCGVYLPPSESWINAGSTLCDDCAGHSGDGARAYAREP